MSTCDAHFSNLNIIPVGSGHMMDPVLVVRDCLREADYVDRDGMRPIQIMFDAFRSTREHSLVNCCVRAFHADEGPGKTFSGVYAFHKM